MHIETIGDYQIWSSDRPGKSVKGTKIKSSIQVRNYGAAKGGYFLEKQFSFILTDPTSQSTAITKAKEYIDRCTDSAEGNDEGDWEEAPYDPDWDNPIKNEPNDEIDLTTL